MMQRVIEIAILYRVDQLRRAAQRLLERLQGKHVCCAHCGLRYCNGVECLAYRAQAAHARYLLKARRGRRAPDPVLEHLSPERVQAVIAVTMADVQAAREADLLAPWARCVETICNE